MRANCWQIISRVCQPAAQKLQFVSHLRDFLHNVGSLTGRTIRATRRNGDGRRVFFHSLLTCFHFISAIVTPCLYHLFK